MFTMPFLLGGIALIVAPAFAASPTSSIQSFTEPYRKIDLAAAEQGTISELLVREGDLVAKGQLVAALDSDVLKVSLEIDKVLMQSRCKLDAAAAERDLRKIRLDSLEALRLKGHANQEEVNRAKADLAIAEADLFAAGQQQKIDALQYKKTEAMLERRTIRSPIDGIVTDVYREEREFVTVSSAAVATVVQLNPLRVVFSLPTGIAQALKAEEMLPLFFPDSSERAQGRVEFVSPVTDAETGTVRIKVLLDNSQGKLRSGVRCNLVLP